LLGAGSARRDEIVRARLGSGDGENPPADATGLTSS
jgi:hypothetical protein